MKNKGFIKYILLSVLWFSLCLPTSYAQEVLYNLQQQYNRLSVKDTERFWVAGKYVQALFFNQQQEKASQILNENILRAQQEKDGQYAAYLYAIKAMNNRINDEITASQQNMAHARQYTLKSQSQEIKGYVAYAEGWLQVRNSNEAEAVRSFLRAIDLYDSSPNSPTLFARKSSVYKELTSIYANWDDYELQEKYSKLSLDLAIRQNDPLAIFDAYMLMGYLHEQHYLHDQQQIDSRAMSEKYYLQAIDTYNKNKQRMPIPSNLSYVASNLANLYFRFYPENYRDKVQYYAELAKKQGLETEQYSHVATAYGIMSEMALEKQDLAQAKAYLLAALVEINKESVSDPRIQMNIYESLARIAEAENNLGEAIRYYKEYMHLFSVIYDQEKLDLGKRLESQFEKERQQQQLKTMQLEADKKEQQLSLMRSLGIQQQQELENLKLHEENQRKQLELTQLESEKRAQELKLSRLETQNRAQDILNYQKELNYKEKINGYYIILILVFSIMLLLLLYAYKQRAKRMQQQQVLHQLAMEQEKQNSKISTLTALLEGQEQERGRLARDLHDGLGGLLSGTKMRLSHLHEKVNQSAKQEMSQSIEQVDMAVDELRRVAHNLMPDLLYKYGLEEALQDYASRMSNERLEVDVQFLHYHHPLPSEEQLLIYRIIQELVNNAIKHAEASQIIVQMAEEEQEYTLTVEDDGKGFNPKDKQLQKSAGLHNIQSRIDFLKGDLHIHSEPGLGTSMEIRFPKQKTK